MRRLALLRSAIVVAGCGAGAVVVLAAYPLGDAVAWIPDLVVGVAFVLLAAWSAGRSSTAAVLAGAVAAAWWAGTLVPDLALYWHRGPLIHLLLTAPLARLPRRWFIVPIAVGYAASLVPVVWTLPAVSVALPAAWIAIAVIGLPVLRPPGRRRLLLAANITVAATIIVLALAGLAGLPPRTAIALLLVYCTVMVGAAATLALLLGTSDSARVADQVVELGEGSSGDYTRALRSALGDPSLRVGRWDAEAGAFRDAEGIVIRDDDPGRRTVVRSGGGEPVLLLHDVPLDSDERLERAVEIATGVMVTNAVMRERSEAAVEEVRLSRERLAEAEREERRAVGARLGTSVLAPLTQLAETWASDDDPAFDGARAQLARAVDALERTVEGIDASIAGDELPFVIHALAERLGIAVRVDVPPVDVSSGVAHALYHVTAEALTNTAKHARAAASTVTMTTADGIARLVVEDDGGGGAQVGAGSGLVGLAARIEALGGTVRIASPDGRGTRIEVDVPLDR